MEFNFNDSNIGRTVFPSGCPQCGGEILFRKFSEVFGREKENRFVYVCEHYPQCDSYTFAHAESKGDAIKYHPQGIVADSDLRSTHSYLRELFNPLWQQRVITQIYHKLVLSFTDPDGNTRYGEVTDLDKASKTYKIKTDTGDEYDVPICLTRKIDSRTRSYFWLASMLGIPYIGCSIPNLDYDMSCRAAEIIQEATKPINNNTDDKSKN